MSRRVHLPGATQVTCQGSARHQTSMACSVHPAWPVNVFSNSLIVNPPDHATWDLGAFQMRAECRSAEGTFGGDFYAFQLRGPKRLAVVIGDACGRGREGASLLPGVLARLEQLALDGARPSHFLHDL